MDQFSLDSVRESFAADVSASIARVAASARAILESPPGMEERTADFDTAVLAFHAIKGTSGLLALRPLATSAQLLEDLAARGRAAVEEAAVRLRQGREVAEACLVGSQQLLHMARLVLAHDEAGVEQAADRLREHLAESTAPLPPAESRSETPSVPEAPSEPAAAAPAPAMAEAADTTGAGDAALEFDFEDENDVAPSVMWTPATESDPLPVGEDELIDAGLPPFQAQARALLDSALAGLSALRIRPDDRGLALELEQSYRDLELGAAAAEWSGIAGVARQAHQDVSIALRSGATFDASLAADLVERTRALLAVIGYPGAPADMADDAVALEASTELDGLFHDEARQACREAARLAERIADVPEADDAVAELGRLAHRLKGSAVLVRHAPVEEAAAALQIACQARLDGIAPDSRRILDRLALLRALVEGAPAAEVSAPRLPVRMEADPAVREGFEIESSESLRAIDAAVLRLEEAADPKAVLAELFRHYHTLKGALYSVGLEPIGRLLHRLEDLTEELLDAPILPPPARLASLLLGMQARVRRHLQEAEGGWVTADLPALEAEVAGLFAAPTLPRSSDSSSRSGASAPSSAGGPSSERSGGSSRRQARPGDVSAGAAPDAIERRIVRVPRERLDALMDLAGELLVTRSRLGRRVEMVRSLERELSGHRDRLVAATESFRERHEFRSAWGSPRGPAGAPAGARAWGFSELELDEYDEINVLARTLGEAASRLSQTQAHLAGALTGISEDAQSFGSVVAGLQGEVTRARMVPLGQLFNRLRAPARDAAEREGKRVRLLTSGEDVALDKALADELHTPLLHLIRNAVAHGIEAPERRRAAGKDESGTVYLEARQESGRVLVTVRDDGAGLDLETLHRLAVEAGVLAPTVPMDSPEVMHAVFVQGLSTRADVGDVSGRGVGGDVVRREVERLGGEVRVETTRGSGTAFTLQLPLTLSITRALWVRAAGQTFALPLAFAQAIVDLADAEVHESAGVRRLHHGGSFLTLHALAEVLGEGGGAPGGAAVVLEAGERRIALAVDRILGQEEIFVKPLGDLFAGHPAFAGVTLGGDGEMLLILDVRGLVQAASGARAGVRAVAAASRHRTLRVLFVDDSLSVRKVGEKFLQEHGVNVTLAVDGADALERLEREAFDLVFTDLEMPRIHGYELIRELRARDAFARLPIVVVTSRSGARHRSQAEEVGATDYLTKPFTARSLVDMVMKWVPSGSRR